MLPVFLCCCTSHLQLQPPSMLWYAPICTCNAACDGSFKLQFLPYLLRAHNTVLHGCSVVEHCVSCATVVLSLVPQVLSLGLLMMVPCVMPGRNARHCVKSERPIPGMCHRPSTIAVVLSAAFAGVIAALLPLSLADTCYNTRTFTRLASSPASQMFVSAGPLRGRGRATEIVCWEELPKVLISECASGVIMRGRCHEMQGSCCADNVSMHVRCSISASSISL